MLGDLDVACYYCYAEDGVWYVHHSLVLLRGATLTGFTSIERTKVRKAMENMLQKAALKILTVVNQDKDHIPPITTSDSNPFPYRIVLNPRADSWQNRLGLY